MQAILIYIYILYTKCDLTYSLEEWNFFSRRCSSIQKITNRVMMAQMIMLTRAGKIPGIAHLK